MLNQHVSVVSFITQSIIDAVCIPWHLRFCGRALCMSMCVYVLMINIYHFHFWCKKASKTTTTKQTNKEYQTFDVDNSVRSQCFSLWAERLTWLRFNLCQGALFPSRLMQSRRDWHSAGGGWKQQPSSENNTSYQPCGKNTLVFFFFLRRQPVLAENIHMCSCFCLSICVITKRCISAPYAELFDVCVKEQ